MPSRFPQRLRLGVLAASLLAFAPGCGNFQFGKPSAPAMNVPARWMIPGTMVVYMPKPVSAAKQQAGDPIYLNWAEALMSYVDESTFVQGIVDQGRVLSPSVHISSKTVPSSDYSVLLVGLRGRAVHVQEPWQSVKLYLLLDDYLRGRGSAKNLPPGCEAITVRPEPAKEEAGGPAAPPPG